jgi:hypothetical protein
MSEYLKWLYRHIALFAVILFGACWGCPIVRLFGVCCPLCGTTRAWISFLSGEITEAFRYHPLFLISPVWFFMAVHYKAIFQSHKIIDYFLLCYAMVLFFYNLLRITGVIACVL